jgi:hypothetical protein
LTTLNGHLLANDVYGTRLWAIGSDRRPLTMAAVNEYGLWSDRLLLATNNSGGWNARGLQLLFDVLTPAQQRTLSDWLGEPYPGTSWHALRASQK